VAASPAIFDRADATRREAAQAARDAAEAVARRSRGALVALLAARTRDAAGAEDALSDAFVAALVDWPARGVPRNPEAWLLTVARRRWIDAARRRRSAAGAAPELRRMAEESEAAAAGATELPDERLSLLLACVHPAVGPAARAPLVLQALRGHDVAAIASAFRVSPATMGQRLVRAKRRLREVGDALHLPCGAECAERLDALLGAIRTLFVAGSSDPARGAGRRFDLAQEAIGLGRLVASLLPREPAALGLLARMLHPRAGKPPRSAHDGYTGA
jgi:RNA polymerase sigma-70 factor (ECF subfamily)